MTDPYAATIYALLFTLAAFGISETTYLIRKRKASEHPVCIIGKGCTKVLDSKYNKLFGLVHNDIMGLLFYLSVSVISAFFVLEIQPLEIWGIILKLMVGIGILLSSYFFYLQWKVIKAWCFWCLASAGTVLTMAIIILFSGVF
ncbi:hypothetical protein IT411_01370 [Candidatus Peregrinibacteria bacterium]|nr:hypothetical protein [Candidatus Peregrinibacteria bacterium]